MNTNLNRYLKISQWLADRYANRTNRLNFSDSPNRYGYLTRLANQKYLNF